MDAKTLDLLVCPLCTGRLQYNKEQETLSCEVDKVFFPIREDVPLLKESYAKPLREGD